MPPSYSPCPRPILKRSSPTPAIQPPSYDEPILNIDASCLAPLVRFPHHAALAHTVGNAISYDRSPIVVLPNRCALPERGCPGRTYSDEQSLRRTNRSSLSPLGKHRHPKAVLEQEYLDDLANKQSSSPDQYHLPPLVPDLSSESSEESDGFASPPPDLYPSSIHTKLSLEHSLMNLTLAGTNAPSSSALSFLPHPPSPRVRPSTSPSNTLATPQCYPLATSTNTRACSPVRSRSPSSASQPRRKSRPTPIPVPIGSLPSSMPTATSPPSVSASPERERRSRHRDERTEHRDRSKERRDRDRSRERRDRDRAERLARYKSLSEANSRLSSFDDGGCLGGF